MNCPCCETSDEKVWACYEPGCGGFRGCEACQVVHLMLIHEMSARLISEKFYNLKKLEANLFPPAEPSTDTETSMEMYQAMSRGDA